MKKLLICLLASLGITPAAAATETDRLIEIASFFEGATVVSGPKIVNCTLSGGTKARCFSITVKSEPKRYTPGPWCPGSIDDPAGKGGIWLEGGKVHDVDGSFIYDLAMLYHDDEWQLYDKQTGKVRVTDTKQSCDAAARPDVDPAYNNYCVQCLPEYMPDDATMTYTIPLEPQRTWLTHAPRFSGVGVANNGVRLDGPAPVDAILAAHTLAPFDDCGGHVNLHVGYHYHAVTDCLSGPGAASVHAEQIGIAMDGYAIYSRMLADGSIAEGLDKCNGHEAEGLGYHYHAADAGANAILPCLHAEAGCASGDPDAACDATARPPRP